MSSFEAKLSELAYNLALKTGVLEQVGESGRPIKQKRRQRIVFVNSLSQQKPVRRRRPPRITSRVPKLR